MPPYPMLQVCRELVWRSQKNETTSLEEIARQFQSFLLTFSAELGFNHRRGRYTTKTAHRCPGYNRIEITLTPDVARSAIVSHLTPIPHEICPVCKEIVKDAEIFACICGRDDNESIPTIRCSACSEWHHRPCISENKDQSFVCRRCQKHTTNTPYFAGASKVTISGGTFINNAGMSTGNERSQHTINSTNNVFNPHNDNSTRISGSGGEIPSMPPRSAGYREDYTQPQPQHRTRTLLNNACAKSLFPKMPSRYVYESRGPSHSIIWMATVYFDGIEYGRGEGRTRNAAGDAAAAQALSKLHDLYPDLYPDIIN